MVGRTPHPPHLIALDWGSTSLRGWLLGEDGEVLAERASEAGASKLGGAGAGAGSGGEAFESALRALVGDWLAATPALPIVACGMVGSKHGWAEAPYVNAPTPLGEFAAHARTVDTASGLRLRIIPGIAWLPPDAAPEVMRGEETQVVALLAAQPELAAGCRVVLPGTHSKWVQVRDAKVVSFATCMTGELYDVLLRHSVLARTAQPGGPLDASAFDRGVEVARAHRGGDLGRLLFGVRTLGLFERMTAPALADYTSGLLIGSEIVSAMDAGSDEFPIRLVGAAALIERYLRAFEVCGCGAEAADVSTASGIWQVARHGGWLG